MSLARYIDPGRRSAAATPVTPTRVQSLRKADLDAMRQWAPANGHDISDRGRIVETIQAEYRKATARLPDAGAASYGSAA